MTSFSGRPLKLSGYLKNISGCLQNRSNTKWPPFYLNPKKNISRSFQRFKPRVRFLFFKSPHKEKTSAAIDSIPILPWYIGNKQISF
jgi:hypothetical protein